MTDNEKIMEMLEQIHHENCFLLSTLTTLFMQDETAVKTIKRITESWDDYFKKIV